MSTATEVKLLTMLNVSAIKRPRELDLPGGFRSPSVSRAQSNDDGSDADTPKRRRRSVAWGGEVGPSGSTYGKGKDKGKSKGKRVSVAEEAGEEGEDRVAGTRANGAADGAVGGSDTRDDDDDDDDDEEGKADDTFNSHFGAEPAVLTPAAVAAATEGEWAAHPIQLRDLGRAVELRPEGAGPIEGKARIVPAIAKALTARSELTRMYAGQLGTYTDLFAHSLDGEADGAEQRLFGEHREALRGAAAAHLVNHVLKTRRRIVRNNEKLAHALANGEATSEPPRDQAFVRPKVLVLLPTRSLALRWVAQHIFPLAAEGTQYENRRPFEASFGLPADEADPLEGKKAAVEFPVDHLENFRGNSDDNFRFGLKVTRKAWRVIMPPATEAKLLDCDIIVASPLAIKMAEEREHSTDYLSCIEILVADGLDVMAMQNWDHVQFVFGRLNAIPREPHGCDFSRVKPWYLDGQAKFLRQTLLFGRYDMPEARALLNAHCFNVAGKRRLDARAVTPGVIARVPAGLRQVFERIDADAPRGAGGVSAEAAAAELDARFEHFTKKTLPALMRSAVSRQHTLIVVPSYFDFVRVTNHLRKADVASYAAISEYSSNAEISRARTLFFKGKRALLVVTERLHFYRRYRLRGARTLVFYAPPEHAQFYSEFLAMPFVGSRDAEHAGLGGSDTDPADVSAHTLFSRFDVLRMERIVGYPDTRRMLQSAEARFDFV